MVRLLGIGDNTVDVYIDQGLQYPGGNAVNVAVQARRLGARASYLGCLGDDARGALLARSLRAEEVDISRVQRPGGANAFSRVVHRGGDRLFPGSAHGVRGRYRLTEEDDAFIAAHELAHTSVHSDIEPHLPRIRRHARLLSYDYSVHLARPGKAETLALVDIAFISASGAPQEVMRHCAAQGPRVVVATLGAAGACALADGVFDTAPSRSAEVVDTLGAGDAFIAGFLVAYLTGAAIPACLRQAATHAALACATPGAFGHGEPAQPVPPLPQEAGA